MGIFNNSRVCKKNGESLKEEWGYIVKKQIRRRNDKREDVVDSC